MSSIERMSKVRNLDIVSDTLLVHLLVGALEKQAWLLRAAR